MRRIPVLSIRHQPVLLEEVLGFLAADGGGCFVDCTLGLGGHAEALLERSPRATLVGIDRDPQALELAAARLSRFGERVQLVAGRFAELERLLTALGIDRVSGVLADLGVSSLQLETAERGFSFMHDGPLDMRMGSAERQELTGEGTGDGTGDDGGRDRQPLPGGNVEKNPERVR